MKPTADDHDPVFDRLVARGLERESDASGNACPDVDLLAAWYDHSLAPAEAARIEDHAASCRVCQQILADLARSEPEVIRAAPVPEPARPLIWHWRWVVPAATAAIVIIIVGARTLIAPTYPPYADQFALKQPPPPPASATPPGTATGGSLPAASAPFTAPAEKAAPPIAKFEGRVADRRAERDAVGALAPAPAAAPPAVGGAPSANALALPAQKPAADARLAEGVAETPARGQAQPQAIGAAESVFVAQPAKSAQRADAAGAAPAAAQAGVAPREAFLFRVGQARQVTASAEPAASPILWRYGDRGAIERSTDRGQSWEPQQSGVDARLADASSPSARVCWIVGAAGTVVRTTDGKTWERVKSPTSADLVSVHAWSENNATITAADRAVYTTADGGATWRRQ